MKYGEHIIANLGEAFDNLSVPGRVKPRTLFPVVGMMRNNDRVALNPRWFSSIGNDSAQVNKLEC